MGCAHSGTRRSFFKKSNSHAGQNKRIFSVINVDDQGNEINHGHMELTSTHLILHQRTKDPIYWPLRSLRRYGFDSELFSFECGRRCQTGSGIYAFKCRHAQRLFNLLQEFIQSCTESNTNGGNNAGNASAPNHISSPSHSQVISPPLSAGLPEAGVPSTNSRFSLTRITSPTSLTGGGNTGATGHKYFNGPFYINSPIADSSHNQNNGSMSGASSHNGPPIRLSGNPEFMSGTTDINTNYAKLDDLVKYYVNINTPASNSRTNPVIVNKKQSIQSQEESEPIGIVDKEDMGTQEDENKGSEHEFVNYIMLDLEAKNGCPTFVNTAPLTPTVKTPESDEDSRWPTKEVYNGYCDQSSPPKSPTTSNGDIPRQYATIDFDKTIALSNSAATHRKSML